MQLRDLEDACERSQELLEYDVNRFLDDEGKITFYEWKEKVNKMIDALTTYTKHHVDGIMSD